MLLGSSAARLVLLRGGGSVAASTTTSASSLTPTSHAARQILARAGFDTPTAPTITTSSAVGASCPIRGFTSLSVTSIKNNAAGGDRCPCGMYPLNSTPSDCPSTTTASVLKSTTTKKRLPAPSIMNTMIHVRAFSTTRPKMDSAAVGGEETTHKIDAKMTSNTAVMHPSPPSPVSLPPGYSAAHSSLLAIEDYRDGIQALSRGSLTSAKQLLSRTGSIVACVPAQPYLLLYVKHLLADIAESEGRWKDERSIRAEIVKEMEKQWKSTGTGASVKDTELLLVSQAIYAYSLVCLRSSAYTELRLVIDTWLPRLETLLFGTQAPQKSATQRTSHHHVMPQAFSTGATHLKLLTQYGTLLQIALFERARSQDSTSTAKDCSKPSALDRSITQLSKLIASRPHLQSSTEWKTIQVELLFLPIETIKIAGMHELLPASTTDAPDSASSRLTRALHILTSHPEMQRFSLSESNMRRDWYSPLVQAYLILAWKGLDQQETGKTINFEEGFSPRDLLSSCLQFIESHLSTDASYMHLLRTLYPLAITCINDGEPIAAEGLLRNVLGKLEAKMEINSSASSFTNTPSVHTKLDIPSLTLYLDALFEYISLLTKLEWNGKSRQEEARSVYYQRLVKGLLQGRDAVQVRRMLSVIQPHTRRVFLLPAANESLPEGTEGVTDKMLELGLNPKRHEQVPLWLQEKLHVGSGIQG